jgi:hypothetical protein
MAALTGRTTITSVAGGVESCLLAAAGHDDRDVAGEGTCAGDGDHPLGFAP